MTLIERTAKGGFLFSLRGSIIGICGSTDRRKSSGMNIGRRQLGDEKGRRALWHST